MPALFVFLLKVNIALLLFCAGYYLVLRHLTFYTLNRIYLVAAILFATLYPKINLDNFALQHTQLARPAQVIILNLQAPAETLIEPLAQPVYWFWLEVVFWIGVALLTIRLLMQIFSLYKLHRSSIPMQIREHNVRIIHGDAGPFSFWRNIYVNPANHEPADLKSILLHEQVHVNEWHTLDILLAELSTIFYWFNPGIWLMKKAVRENIEFITDRKILNKGVDTKAYQYSLVNVTFAAAPQNIVNHFNLSTVKKRIIMMNAKKSSKFTLTRYALLTPVVVALLLVFSVSKAAFVTKSAKAFTRFTAAIKPEVLIRKIQKDLVTQAMLVNKAITSKKQQQDTTVKPAWRLNAALVPDTNHKHTGTFSYSLSFDSSKKFKKFDSLKVFKQAIRYEFAFDTTKKAKSNDPVMVPTTYYVDGKVVQPNEVGAMNPQNIASLSVVTSPNGKQAVVNIITKNNSQPGAVLNIRINGKTLQPANGQLVNGTVALIDTIRDLHNKPKIVKGHVMVDTVFLGHPNAALPNELFDLSASAKNTFTPRTGGLTPITVQGFSIAAGDGLNHLSGKMFVINGKVATEGELKKLSAFDIEKMVVKNDEETKSLYGDKAKNGIVFIVTKKAK